MRPKTKIAILLLAFASVLKAQDPEFAQFYANPLYLNPAFAGTEVCPRITLNFRDQWPSLGATYITSSASYDQKVDLLHGGVGFLGTHDSQARGTINTLRLSGIYSYHLTVSRKFNVNFGIEATYHHKNIDWARLTFSDQIDDRNGFIYATSETNNTRPVHQIDFSAGVLGYTDKVYFGLALHHFTQPNQSLIGGDNVSKLPIKLTFHGGAMLPLNKGKREKEITYISPNLMLRYQGLYLSGQHFQTLVGLYLRRDIFTGGIWYRTSGQDIIISLGVKVRGIKIGYSYDFSTKRNLVSRTGGAHEISLGYVFKCGEGKKRMRMLSCPGF